MNCNLFNLKNITSVTDSDGVFILQIVMYCLSCAWLHYNISDFKRGLCSAGGVLWLHRWHPLLHLWCWCRHLPQRQLRQAHFLVSFQMSWLVPRVKQEVSVNLTKKKKTHIYLFKTNQLISLPSFPSPGMITSSATATVSLTCCCTCTPKSRHFLSIKEIRKGTTPTIPPSHSFLFYTQAPPIAKS